MPGTKPMKPLDPKEHVAVRIEVLAFKNGQLHVRAPANTPAQQRMVLELLDQARFAVWDTMTKQKQESKIITPELAAVIGPGT